MPHDWVNKLLDSLHIIAQAVPCFPVFSFFSYKHLTKLVKVDEVVYLMPNNFINILLRFWNSTEVFLVHSEAKNEQLTSITTLAEAFTISLKLREYRKQSTNLWESPDGHPTSKASRLEYSTESACEMTAHSLRSLPLNIMAWLKRSKKKHKLSAKYFPTWIDPKRD